ncbi:trypsin-like [Drosophila hydei]|uniref:Trypsin-like n=1 Tax=Drosophila hydei TaxID=7224 RepID=A0A6J1LI57_DROHY|nr:trypsin-like [Drosophila hydei]
MFLLGGLITYILLLYPLTLANLADDDKFKVVSGFNAELKDVPYQASVRLIWRERKRLGSGHFCGGTVISSRVVVTAAHCLSYSIRPSDLVVVLGNRLLNAVSPTMRMFQIVGWRIHQQYYKHHIDIALIFTSHDIRPIAGAIAFLPLNTRAVPEGTSCLVSGWGRTVHNVSGHTNALQAAWIPIGNPEHCTELYKSTDVICAGFTSMVGSSSCKGDSGGPLRCDNELAGIVSRGIHCGTRHRPSAYTSIRYHARWIQQQSQSFNGVLPLRSTCIQGQVGLAFIIYVTTR